MPEREQGDQRTLGSEWSAARAPAAPQPTWDPRTGAWIEPGSEPARAPQSEGAPTAHPERGRSNMRAVIVGAIVGAIVATLIAVPVTRMTTPDTPAVEQRAADRLPSGTSSGSSIVDIAARTRPWVVNINVTTEQRTLLGTVQGGSLGSGVIMRSDGHIVTNAHVVEVAGAIEVTLASGEKLAGKLVGTDPETDIAVIKVDRDDLPSAVLGSVKDLRVGETAIAIGSPLGLEQSVTAGIISALGRRVPRAEGVQPLVDMIQTDAPVTQGNSGGALIDGGGAVVGINTAIAASPEVGAEGVAFATPIDVAIAVARELIATGRATHPWLGVTGGDISPEAAREFGVEQGALVIEVVSGAPAERAGIRPNDVVVSFDGERIDSMDDLIIAIRQHKVGEQVRLVVVRDGRRLTLTATLGDKPATS